MIIAATPAATIIVVVIVVLGVLAILSVLGSLYRKVGPNRALIVYGRGGTKVVVGGGAVVMPLFQSSQEFSLELLSFDIVPRADLYTSQGIPVKIEAVTQLKVENEEEKIRRAANQFLSKRQEEREGIIRQVMEGHLRGIVGQLTVEQLVKAPEMVSQRMRDTVAADLDKLGLEVVSFTIKDVNDDSGYIQNMSRPIIAANKRAADIADAEALRDVAIRQSETQREAAQARAKAEQETAVSQSQAAGTRAEAQRDLDLKQAEFKKSTAAAQAEAEMAGEIAKAQAQRALVDQQSAVELLRAQRQQQVQEAEAQRKAAELVAEVQRPAEAQANATKVKADGDAAATRARAQAEAEQIRLRGQADAEVQAVHVRATGEAEAQRVAMVGKAEAESIEARGLAEASALEARTTALNKQGEPAIIQQALIVLPEIAERLGQAYAKVGTVTYLGGDGDGGVAGKMARDVMGMMPAVNGMLESVTGINLGRLIARRLDAGETNGAPIDAGTGTSNGSATSPAVAATVHVQAEGSTGVPSAAPTKENDSQ